MPTVDKFQEGRKRSLECFMVMDTGKQVCLWHHSENVGTVLEILSGDLLSLFMGIGYWAASFGYVYLWRPIARLTIVTAQR